MPSPLLKSMCHVLIFRAWLRPTPSTRNWNPPQFLSVTDSTRPILNTQKTWCQVSLSCKKEPQTGWLNTRSWFKFWRLESQSQAVSKVWFYESLFWLLVVTGNLCYSLLCRCVTQTCTFVFTCPDHPYILFHFSKFSCPYRTSVTLDLEPTNIWPHLTLMYICMDNQFPNKVTFTSSK